MIEVIPMKGKKKKLRFFAKDEIYTLASGIHFMQSNSDYESTLWSCILDYIECSLDNRNPDDYENFLSDNGDTKAMDVNVIVKLGDKKQYVLINEEDETFSFVSDLNKASLFDSDHNETLSYYIHYVREFSRNNSFVAASINTRLLDEPLENLIKGYKQYLD